MQARRAQSEITGGKYFFADVVVGREAIDNITYIPPCIRAATHYYYNDLV